MFLQLRVLTDIVLVPNVGANPIIEQESYQVKRFLLLS